jgi:hypothetical protein
MPELTEVTLAEQATLRVGWAPDLPLQRLQSLLGALYAHDAMLRPDVLHLPSGRQLTCLATGRLDIGLMHEAAHDASIESEPVFPGEQLAAFVGTHHRLAERGAVAADDLEAEVLLVRPRAAEPGLHACLEGLRAAGTFRFREVRETSGSDVRDLLLAVAEARGVTLAPWSALRAAGELAALVTRHALDPAQRMPETVLSWRAQPIGARYDLSAEPRTVARELRGSCSAG